MANTKLVRIVHTETVVVPVLAEDGVDIEARMLDLAYADLEEIVSALRDGNDLVGAPKFPAMNYEFDLNFSDGEIGELDPKIMFHVLLRNDGSFDYGPVEDGEPVDVDS